MIMNANRWTAWSPQFLSILRIIAAFIFMIHGTTKLFAFPAPRGGGGPVELMSLMGLAGALETFGGLLLLLGLFTRPVAFILAGEMAVAYFMAHAPRSFWPTLNGGVASALFSFVWLYISSAGPGPWSLDALWKRKPPAPPDLTPAQAPKV